MSVQAEKSPAQSAIDWVVGHVHGHVSNVTRQWGGRLHFSESGRARLVATVGWIDAYRFRDEEAARTLALALVERLDWLAGYGGNIEVGGFEFPKCRVVLSDDGGLNSFGLSWYSAATSGEDGCERDLMLDRWRDGSVVRCHYKRWMAGAMIYRGPDHRTRVGDPVLLDRTNDIWTIHT